MLSAVSQVQWVQSGMVKCSTHVQVISYTGMAVGLLMTAAFVWLGASLGRGAAYGQYGEALVQTTNFNR